VRLSPDDLAKITQRRGYHLSAFPVPTGICNPQPKQDAPLPPLGQDQDEEGGAGRFRVRITRRGARLLDADNLGGSVKFILDALRYRNIIPEDNPASIELEVSQEITPKKDRGTLIQVERIPSQNG
jgi:hypothetical protein